MQLISICHAGIAPHIHAEPFAAAIAIAFGVVLALVVSRRAGVR